MVKKYALLTAINNYPGEDNDLSGCLNDIKLATTCLSGEFSFDSIVGLADEDVTKKGISDAMKAIAAVAVKDDEVVWVYSGHGTNYIDLNGDEVDGYDEALYVYDGVFLDDEISKLIALFAPGVHITIIFDSCFSGTATKGAFRFYRKPRYVKTCEVPENLSRKKAILSGTMAEVLMAGCSDGEYSFDAYINGQYNGAFSAALWPNMKKEYTYNEAMAGVLMQLPSNKYPQTPQLEGEEENLDRKLFSGSAVVDPPTPPDAEPGWLIKMIRKFVAWVKKIFSHD